MQRLLPDAVGQALGAILAEQRKEWTRERERIEADAKALLAETRAELTTYITELRSETAALRARIDEHLSQVRDGKDGEQGPPGRDADDEAIVERVLERMPRPEPGPAGRDADEDAIVERVMARIPAPEKGDPGPAGAAGKDADPEFVVKLVDEAVAEAIAEAVAALPPPQDAIEATVGREVEKEIVKRIAELPPPVPGPEGPPGPQGERGLDGKDGVGLAGAMIDRDGNLVLTLTDGTLLERGRVVGKDGEPGPAGQDGRDGVDGITFDDVEWHLDYDGERSATVRVVSKGKSVEWPLRFPAIIDRGVYKPETAYERGDAVSHGGNLWIAQTDTREKPGGNGDWRLAIRHGRDGRDGKDGAKGDKGEPGRPGRDLTLG